MNVCYLVVDNCVSKPCQHGRCLNYPGGFTCRCDEGFTGRLCSQGTASFKMILVYALSFKQLVQYVLSLVGTWN